MAMACDRSVLTRTGPLLIARTLGAVFFFLAFVDWGTRRHQQPNKPASLARFKCYLLQSNQEPIKCVVPCSNDNETIELQQYVLSSSVCAVSPSHVPASCKLFYYTVHS
jgi:hypothetical protein